MPNHSKLQIASHSNNHQPNNNLPNKDLQNKNCNQKTFYQSISIRDELERLARMQNPELTQQMQRRRQRINTSIANQNLKRQYASQSLGSRLRRAIRWQDRVLISLSAILLSLFVVRAGTAEAAEQSWGMQLKSEGLEQTQLAIDTDVQVDITGLIARVEVTQFFSNQSDQWVEGIYRFPLPDGAAVDRLRIKIGDRILEGEIQEKKTARRIYQKARKNGQTATLVEQQRHNQFENRIANIGPGEIIEVTIGYLQNVEFSDFSYHLNIPMTFTPRWTPQVQTQLPVTLANQFTEKFSGKLLDESDQLELLPAFSVTDHTLSLQVRLTTSSELAAIESRFHDVDISQIGDGYQINIVNPYALADRDFELNWTPALLTSPSTSLTTYNDGDAVYAQLMLAPPTSAAIQPQAREVILIIDTSGSMEGASLEQAKAALAHALSSLSQDDYFNLLEFNSVTSQLFANSVPLNRQNVKDAMNFIRVLQANGGTDMQPALETALAMPEMPDLMRQVVFITDGAVGNEQQLLQLVAHKLGSSRMFTIAIGHAPNSWFMRKTAEIGRGSFVHIGQVDEVEKQMSALWQRIQLPALTDICVDWGDDAEYYPEIVPDLYAGEPLWLIARLPVEPSMIHLCGQFNDQPWEMDVNGFDATAASHGNDNLAILWARKRIEALEDSLMFGADPELTELEITDTALKFGLLTKHTSLVAVDKTPRRSAAQAYKQNLIPGLLPAGTSAQMAGFPATATGWIGKSLLSLLVLLLSSSLLWFSGSRLPMAKVQS
jgi:Ca-activated chloride channel family protein